MASKRVKPKAHNAWAPYQKDNGYIYLGRIQHFRKDVVLYDNGEMTIPVRIVPIVKRRGKKR